VNRVHRLVLLAVGLALLTPAPASASTATAAAYLERQLADGCVREGGTTNLTVTGWTAIGLEAAGRSGARPVACLARAASRLRSATDLEVAILAATAAGRNPRALGGRNLVAALLRHRRGGAIGPYTNSTIFGVLALRGARASVPAPVVRRLLALQRPDGGVGVAPGVPSDSNTTAAAIQALRAVGVGRRAPRMRRAVAALAAFRNADGGYGLDRRSPSDAQSTAWVVQALASAGRPTIGGRRFLLRLQRRDGAVRYSRRSAQTPVWVTAQALAALANRPLPVR
jgi:hypothetical protein